MRTIGWMLLAAALTACSSSSGGSSTTAPPEIDGVVVMPGFDPGPPPSAADGFQVVLPIVKDIQPGASDEWCSWTDITTTDDVWVKESKGLQTQSGHHVIVYYTTVPQPAGTSRICNDSDMATFRFAVASGGEGVSQDNILPGDLAVHMPKGSQIVINHHYLNATADVIPEAQSAVTVYYAAAGSKIVETSSLAFADTGMSVPPGLHSVDIMCTMKQDFAAWEIIPHMHNWGAEITVDQISGSTTSRLFDVVWDPGYAFHPPITTFDLSAPHTFMA